MSNDIFNSPSNIHIDCEYCGRITDKAEDKMFRLHCYNIKEGGILALCIFV